MAATRGTRVEQRPPSTTDAQVETSDPGELFEVLTEQPSEHRTVHRVRAKDRSAAEKAVREQVADELRVLGSAEAGCGLGSG